MKYDTSPLSLDTLESDHTPPETPVRFAPANHDIHRTNDGAGDSGPVSQATVLSARNETNIGFDTFIEDRAGTDPLKDFSDDSSRRRYLPLVRAGALAAISAVAGGSVVYYSLAGSEPRAVQQPVIIANTATTDIQPSDAFVIKAPVETAAEEAIAQRPSGPVGQRERQARGASKGTETDDEPPSDQPSVAAQPVRSPEREAKVGGYVAERPAGRRPLARCSDGTYSFSASKSSACSGRGGVSEWMTDGKPSASAPAKQAAYVLGPRGGCYYLDSSDKKVYVEKKHCQ